MTLAAIAFDPEIRGILVVLVGAVVLVGSVYAIIATNSGMRAGFLIAGAGLFGWMFLMGLIWWMYGIGLIGRQAAWMPAEINFDRSAPVATKVVEKLPPADRLPDPVETLNRYPLLKAIALGSEGPDFEPETLGQVVTVATPLVLATARDVAEVIRPGVERNATEFIKANPDLEKTFALSNRELAKVIQAEARMAREEIEEQLGGWCLLSETDPRRGEAVASADAILAEEKAFGDQTSPSDYIVGDVFVKGGKEPCFPIAERAALKQAWHRIATTFEVKNPKLYGVVTVTKAKQVEVAPGETPPPPSIEPGASTVSVIMVRNLGNKRFIPFLFTLASLIMFVVFSWQLHERDKRAMAARAAFEASKK
jgi:hypothetical protein